MTNQEAKTGGYLGGIAQALASLKEAAPQLGDLTDDLQSISQQAQIAVQQLPELLREMPDGRRESPSFPRLIYALVSGAFDSAVNHAWNMTIEELREKIRGSDVHLFRKDVKEHKMTDSEIVTLCHNLNLIDVPTHFRLQQCCTIRNKFSAAHKAIGALGVYECLAFVSNSCCLKFDAGIVKAIDIKEFMDEVKSGKMDEEKIEFWATRIRDTFDEQKKFILVTLYELNCDYSTGEVTKLAFELCIRLKAEFTEEVMAEIEKIHHRLRFDDSNDRYRGSRWFYIYLGIASRLDEFERKDMVLSYCTVLRQAHQGVGDARDEETPARLLERVVREFEVPEQIAGMFVEVVVTCAVGHPEGVCTEAEQHYRKMIGNFSADEVRAMLALANSKTLVGDRMERFSVCKDRYRQVVGWLNSDNVPPDAKGVYDVWCGLDVPPID